MSVTMTPTADAIALFSKDGQQWSDSTPVDWRPNPAVTKIVIGSLESGDDDAAVSMDLPEDLAVRYANLTHLHLWGVSNLEALPELPPGLRCLDLRGCRKLESVPALPSGLGTLVLENCAKLTAPGRTEYPRLTELSIKACPQVREAWLHSVLRAAPELHVLDASACPQVTRIPVWAPKLVDVRLDGCTALRALPSAWPIGLRRVGLRGAESLQAVPNFGAALDYIDLAGTRALRRLPDGRGAPRTLFLHGTGVLVPPATEHGATASENVAARTASYFADVALTGQGDVKRCKLLILGNGNAGKTCLSLALTGRDPAGAERLGSTHGVQFWDWEAFHANIDSTMEPVRLHLWDFGGQEIYHNTHQLFMGKGAVFLVVWDPGQDGKQPPAGQGDYQDEWRPLEYWLDFIQLTCSHKPRIAIVCSHRTARTDELELRWKRQVRPEFADGCKSFYVDSLTKTGQFDELRKWLEDEVGDVVVTQGRSVPAYWEIAQNMVNDWLKASMTPSPNERAKQLELAEFRSQLGDAIEHAIQSGDERYRQLNASRQSGQFELTDDRVRRTLEFLTHSGWVYWDEKLFEGRVIVGQQWALDGIYAILDRKKDSRVFRELTRKDGCFTLSDLAGLAWNRLGFSRTEQQLLLTYMERCGLCFRLRAAEDAWREENVYVSFEHLPTAKVSRLANDFFGQSNLADIRECRLDAPMLHKLHWQRFLVHAGGYFGKDAEYASDGLLVKNKQGQWILVLSNVGPGGLGGNIEISVVGPDADERLKEIEALVKSFLPGGESRSDQNPERAIGARAEIRRVFVSYAWNDKDATVDYEAPVRAIEDYFDAINASPTEAPSGSRVELVRDKTRMEFGDGIVKFMETAARHPHVIVVHSQKYWRSTNCVYELKQIEDDLRNQKGKSFLSVVIPVEHPSSRIGTQLEIAEHVEFWTRFDGDVPPRSPWKREDFRVYAPAVISDFGRTISEMVGINIRWSDGKDAVLRTIAQRLNLPLRSAT